MFNVTIEIDDTTYTLDVTDIRFVNKWGDTHREEVWVFTNEYLGEPFSEEMRHIGDVHHLIWVADKQDIEKVTIE